MSIIAVIYLTKNVNISVFRNILNNGGGILKMLLFNGSNNSNSNTEDILKDLAIVLKQKNYERGNWYFEFIRVWT